MAAPLEELVLELKAKVDDLKNVTTELKGIQKETKETEKSAGKLESALTNLGKAAAGLTVLRKIGDMLGLTVQKATDYEKALLRLDSASRAFGQNADKARKAAQELSKDGFGTLEQNAKSISNLFASGLNVDQSKKFLAAAKDIAAFGNTTGDAAQSVEDLTKGILTNSAEIIENASPALKEINSRYQENVKTIGKAQAVQGLYNDVLQLGTKFQGDAQKSLQTYDGVMKRVSATMGDLTADIGKQVQEAFRPLLEVGLELLQGFTAWFSSLSDGSKKVLILYAALLPLGGSILSIVSALKGLIPLLGKLGISLTAGLGPLGLFLAGITALTAGYIAYTEAQARNEKARREYKELEELNRLSAAMSKTATEKQRLLDLEKKYPEETNFLKALRRENLGIVANMNALQEYREMQQNLAANPQSAEARRIAAIQNQARQQGQEFNRQRIDRLRELIAERENAANQIGLSISADPFNTAVVQANQREQQRQLDIADRLRLELNARRGVNFQNRNTTSNGGFPSGGGGGGGGNTPQEIVAEYRRFEATFIEELQNTLEDIEKTFTEETKGIEKSSKQYQDALKKRNLEIARAELDSLNQRLGAVNDAIDALQTGDIGGVLQGAGGVIGGSIGASIGAAGGVFSGLAGIAQSIGRALSNGPTGEQLIQKQLEENERQTKLLEQQIELQRALLDLQRERDRVEFEGLEIQKRINNLTLSPDQARNANIELVRQQVSGFSSTVQNAAESGQGFEQIRNREIDLKEAAARFGRLGSPAVGDIGGWNNYISELNSIREIYTRNGIPTAQIDTILPLAQDAIRFSEYYNAAIASRDINRVPIAQIQRTQVEGQIQQLITNPALNASSNLQNLLSQTQADISDVSTLLGLLEEEKSLLENISDSTTRTAENTDPVKLSKINDREFSFLDIGLGRLFSGGSAINLNPSALKVPDSLASVSLASQDASVPDLQLRALEAIRANTLRTVELLGVIAQDRAITPEALQTILGEIKARTF